MLFLFVLLLRLGFLLGSFPSLSYAQAQLVRQQLILGSLTTINGTETARPHAYDIPAADQLSVSIALCGSSLTSDAAFYVTNNTRQNVEDIIAQGGDDSTWAVDIQDGFGVWTGAARDGAIIAFKSANTTIEIGVSTSGKHIHVYLCTNLNSAVDPVHRRSDELPWLGDSTSNLAIVYSPLLSPSNTTEPEFPNYTLQAANATMDTPSEALNSTNFTFSIFPTSSSLDSTVPKTGCALRAASGTVGKMVSDTLWQRPGEGWRNEWLIGGLSPGTNYTMYSIINGTQISGPLYFTTKSG
jgi:calcium channel MID1